MGQDLLGRTEDDQCRACGRDEEQSVAGPQLT
jgi:hypothetical protein